MQVESGLMDIAEGFAKELGPAREAPGAGRAMERQAWQQLWARHLGAPITGRYLYCPFDRHLAATESILSLDNAPAFQKGLASHDEPFRSYAAATPDAFQRLAGKTEPPSSSRGGDAELLAGAFARELLGGSVRLASGRLLLSAAQAAPARSQFWSSGQRQLSPMLLLLAHEDSSPAQESIPGLIVEEPESHIHPAAQRLLLEALVDSFVTREVRPPGSGLVLTTHGPYIAMAINNLLAGPQGNALNSAVRAHEIDDGVATLAHDEHEHIIVAATLDDVSTGMLNEYALAMEQGDR